ncbi:creatininase family protein [Paenibacillus sp. LHD-117]|uniref:creatininase family protein n=1 Tax=Paenibacillus sp. LHD-117 TaxID=3071412 RepID=UPI0027DF2386|nr:creatininase family protein [Paenibacillus sp. LHD-117]MDQ6423575.1 creatininase family protein [Paenibacillus sp. LHD-117]
MKSRNRNMNNQKVLYEELMPAEFVERINDCPIAYLPLGTLEWHGYHLPLGSDDLQSKGFFTELAKSIGGIVLPMLFLGPEVNVNKDGFDYVGIDHYSFEDGYPQQLEGTAYYIEEELFVKVLEATLWNLSRAGFKIVVAHGHGPSNVTFGKCIEKFEKQFGLKLFELWDIGGTGNQGIQTDHAAFNETSLVLGLYPELADMDRLQEDADMIGIWGLDPRGTASEEEGRTIISNKVTVVGNRLKEELSKLKWAKREMKYSNMKKLYNE